MEMEASENAIAAGAERLRHGAMMEQERSEQLRRINKDISSYCILKSSMCQVL